MKAHGSTILVLRMAVRVKVGFRSSGTVPDLPPISPDLPPPVAVGERPSAVCASYTQCSPRCQVFRVSRVKKLLKTGCVAGCDWTADDHRSWRNGRRGLRYGTGPLADARGSVWLLAYRELFRGGGPAGSWSRLPTVH